MSIFILLTPSIIFYSDAGEIESGSGSLLGLISVFFSNAFPIGPVMLSTKLGAVLAVPVRLLLSFNKQQNTYVLMLWIAGVMISTTGLYLAVIYDIENLAGITTGFRSTLSIGAILLPLIINYKQIESKIVIIAKTSIVLSVFGLTVGHWNFITVSLAVMVLFTEKKLPWKILSIYYLSSYVFGGATFTYVFTIIIGIILFTLKKGYTLQLLTSKFSFFSYLMFPVIVVLVVSLASIAPVLENIASQRFINKLFIDRGILWLWTINLIVSSNIWLVPAARSYLVINYGGYGDIMWEPGAHNIYLEMARQNGLFVSVIMFIMIAIFFFKYVRHVRFERRSVLINTIYCFIPIYMVFGLTGNSLIYDGVGFLYWFLFSQFVRVALKTNIFRLEKIPIALGRSNK